MHLPTETFKMPKEMVAASEQLPHAILFSSKFPWELIFSRTTGSHPLLEAEHFSILHGDKVHQV